MHHSEGAPAFRRVGSNISEVRLPHKKRASTFVETLREFKTKFLS